MRRRDSVERVGGTLHVPMSTCERGYVGRGGTGTGRKHETASGSLRYVVVGRGRVESSCGRERCWWSVARSRVSEEHRTGIACVREGTSEGGYVDEPRDVVRAGDG